MKLRFFVLLLLILTLSIFANGLQLKRVLLLNNTGPVGNIVDHGCIVDSDQDGWLEYIFHRDWGFIFTFNILEYHPVNRFELVLSDTSPPYPYPRDSVFLAFLWPTDAGDIDGDGKTDIIGDAIYLNREGWKTAVCVVESPDFNSYPDSIVWWDSLPGDATAARVLLLTDMDRDGRMEIVQGYDGTMVFENVADNRESLVYYAPPGTNCDYAIDDFDQNGKTDYAVFRYSQIRISECIGDNQYAVVCSLNPEQIDCRQLWTGNDIDKNGRPEFFASFVQPRGLNDTLLLYLFEATNEHEYAYYQINADLVSPNWSGSSLCADLDGDSIDEIIWSGGSRVHILKATAPHQFERVFTWWNDIGGYAACNAGDFNGNGYNEVIIGEYPGTSFLEVEAIKILYPNRVRELRSGDTCWIRWQIWTPPRCDSVSLFLLTDTVVPEGERFWRLDTIVTGLTPTESSYAWVVPDTTLGWAKIVAIAYGPGWQFDASDSAFAIVPIGITEEKPEVISGWSLRVSSGFGSVNIRYDVPYPSFVRLSLYDATGRLVKELTSGRKEKGRYSLSIPKEIGAGIYFVRLEAEKVTECKKVIVLK